MTQIFSEKGDCVPVTVIQVDKCVPVLKKTVAKDGYEAVLVAYGERKSKHTNKPLQGFYDKIKFPPAKFLAEFRGQVLEDADIGKPLNVDMFNEGDLVNVVEIGRAHV